MAHEQAGRTRRERMRDATSAEIMTVARQQMAEQGTAALSLRAVAREMGLTAPALYRYFASRDELLTALILAAYNDLADSLEAAYATALAAQRAADKPADETYAEVYLVGLMSYRAWALAHPVEYQLIQGNPIPGYHAPMEVTQPAAHRTMNVFVDLLRAAWRAGRLTIPPEYATPADVAETRELTRRLMAWNTVAEYGVPPALLEIALATWGSLHGLISLELFGHLQPIIGDPELLYRGEALALIARLRLGEPAPIPADETPLI